MMICMVENRRISNKNTPKINKSKQKKNTPKINKSKQKKHTKKQEKKTPKHTTKKLAATKVIARTRTEKLASTK